MRLRTLVVDDHELVQAGLRSLLVREPWVERCVAAGGGAEAVELARRVEPHVALVDVDLGGEAGCEVAVAVRAASPGTRILLIAAHGVSSAAAVRAAGAVGMVGKEWGGRELVEAVRRAALGRPVDAGRSIPCALLSVREREVLDLIARGATNREVAESLHLSPDTVKQHASAAFRKLRARNRTDAVRRGQRLGLIG